MPLNIVQHPAETGSRTVRIALEGRLDSNSYEQLESLLQPVITGEPRLVILDLAKLEFISSAGLRVLLSARSDLQANHGKLLLTNLQPQIEKVLEIVKALPGITVFSSVEELDAYLAAMQQKVIDEKQ